MLVSMILVFFIFVSGLHGDTLFQKDNTQYTFLFRTDFGSLNGSTLFPASFMLIESNFQYESLDFDTSLMIQGTNDSSDTYAGINQLSATWYVGDNEIKVGRFVTFVGVMDHLSVVNLLNPIRTTFFDDVNPNIRRVPQWMTETAFHIGDTETIRFFLEPFDRRYQDYTSAYLSLALDTLMPKILNDYRLGDETLDTLKEQIFLPAYRNAIAPAIKNSVNDYYDFDDLTLDKTLVGFDISWTDEMGTIGVSWFNKYSEIPYIEIDSHILDIIQDTENGWHHFKEYLEQNDLSLVKSVEGFRYNQYLLYGESTVGEYGLRAELFWRDRIPFLDTYSTFIGAGLGVDRNGETYYNEIEIQWMQFEENGENLYALLWACRHAPFYFNGVEVTLENYTMYGAMEGEHQISFLPKTKFTFRHHLQLELQYLYYPDEPDYNTFITTLGVRF
jgi:hypothetical protein